MAEGLLADSSVRGQLRIVAWEIVGAIAAVEGNRARIAEADQWLEAAGSRYSFGNNTVARAGIAALQGRKSDAVQLLQQAVTEGWPFDNNHHIDYELRPLHGYPPFEAWLRPKG